MPFKSRGNREVPVVSLDGRCAFVPRQKLWPSQAKYPQMHPTSTQQNPNFFNRVGSAGLREHPGEFDEGTPSWNVTILFVRPPHIRSHPAEQVTLEPRWFLFWPCLSNVLPLARMANG